jgi:hypothetical protein
MSDSLSQSVASPATAGSISDVSQLSLSQPDDFPIEVLPERVFVFVLVAATALGVDLAVIAGPCLAALAGCIGNRRRIVIKAGAWYEACVLWIAIVQRSGGKKTPAISLVLEHLQELEAEEIEAEKARKADYDEEFKAWQSEPKEERGEPPLKPDPARRLLVSDITTEGLLSVHATSPLGLLLNRDELGGWLRSFNQYKGGKGADAQTWCEVHQGKPALIDRKGSQPLSVPRAAVSIIGGIQPELLRNAISGEHLFDGVASRILFVAPPERVKTWSDDTISDDARNDWTNLLDELLALRLDKDGNPIDLPITNEAKAEWVAYYDLHAQRESEADGPYRSALAKLEAITARLALVVQLAHDPQSTEVGVEAMKAGIAISEWFEGQARFVYSGLIESEQERDRREACEWIADQGGKTTRRDLTRFGPGRLRKRVGAVLDDLVEAGLVRQVPQSRGRAAEYQLCDSDSCDTDGRNR